MQLNIEITPATIEALAKGISYILDALGNHPGGILMLVLVILSIGVAGALFHMQLKLT